MYRSNLFELINFKSIKISNMCQAGNFCVGIYSLYKGGAYGNNVGA